RLPITRKPLHFQTCWMCTSHPADFHGPCSPLRRQSPRDSVLALIGQEPTAPSESPSAQKILPLQLSTSLRNPPIRDGGLPLPMKISEMITLHKSPILCMAGIQPDQPR